MKLDFTPLKNAICQLEESLSYATSPMAQMDKGLFRQFRNSAIQCFEFTYELSHKMLRRYLQETSADMEQIDLGTFQNLIRLGNERRMLRSDWPRWRMYRQARNDSSHTYDEEKAETIYTIIPDFLEEARYLYQRLETCAIDEI